MTQLNNDRLTAAWDNLTRIFASQERDAFDIVDLLYGANNSISLAISGENYHSLYRDLYRIMHRRFAEGAGEVYLAGLQRPATAPDAIEGRAFLTRQGIGANRSYLIIQGPEVVREEGFNWVHFPFDDMRELIAEESGDLVVEVGDRVTSVTLAPHILETLPTGARPYAVAIRDNAPSVSQRRWDTETEQFVASTARTSSVVGVTVESLREQAVGTWRTMLRSSISQVQFHPEFEQQRAEHRRRSADAFVRFFRREADTEQHVGTLPFVPHGLSSSRRWGIEVESGGARGVQAPDDWNAVSDGSLRSAYDGWVEVQNFEPYDETVESVTHPSRCTNFSRHEYVHEQYNSLTDEYDYVINTEYINPADCPECGLRTEIVHRTPQTIRHRAERGDCREFVSPILVSMHSNGLESLTAQLSVRPQNDSSGVHVHVEASDLTNEQIATLVYGYDLLEPILESSYRRNRRDYCERASVDDVLRAARAANGEGGFVPGNRERYLTLNTQALSRHGTLEFRAMGPVYEYEYLVRWAMLCRELVNSVANGATTKDFSRITNWQALLNFLARFGKEYVRAATYELSGEVGEAPRLEKAGQSVTNEALDADLDSLLRGNLTPYTSVNRMSDDLLAHWQALAASMRSASVQVNNLVSVAGAAEV